MATLPQTIIDEQEMQCYISPNLFWWRKVEYIFGWTVPLSIHVKNNISLWMHWTHVDLNNNPCLEASRPDTHSHITSSQLIKHFYRLSSKKKNDNNNNKKMITCCLSLSDTYRETWIMYCFRLTNWMEKIGLNSTFLERHIMVNICSDGLQYQIGPSAANLVKILVAMQRRKTWGDGKVTWDVAMRTRLPCGISICKLTKGG